MVLNARNQALHMFSALIFVLVVSPYEAKSISNHAKAPSCPLHEEKFMLREKCTKYTQDQNPKLSGKNLDLFLCAGLLDSRNQLCSLQQNTTDWNDLDKVILADVTSDVFCSRMKKLNMSAGFESAKQLYDKLKSSSCPNICFDIDSDKMLFRTLACKTIAWTHEQISRLQSKEKPVETSGIPKESIPSEPNKIDAEPSEVSSALNATSKNKVKTGTVPVETLTKSTEKSENKEGISGVSKTQALQDPQGQHEQQQQLQPQQQQPQQQQPQQQQQQQQPQQQQEQQQQEQQPEQQQEQQQQQEKQPEQQEQQPEQQPEQGLPSVNEEKENTEAAVQKHQPNGVGAGTADNENQPPNSNISNDQEAAGDKAVERPNDGSLQPDGPVVDEQNDDPLVDGQGVPGQEDDEEPLMDGDKTSNDEGVQVIIDHKSPLLSAQSVQYPPQKPSKEDIFVDSEDSHFFAYFMLVSLLCIVGYLVYHNKRKIIAMAVEGKKGRNTGRRRPNSASYHKLDSNLEEAMSSTQTSSQSYVIY